jgi:hypothetical protein
MTRSAPLGIKVESSLMNKHAEQHTSGRQRTPKGARGVQNSACYGGSMSTGIEGSLGEAQTAAAACLEDAGPQPPKDLPMNGLVLGTEGAVLIRGTCGIVVLEQELKLSA